MKCLVVFFAVICAINVAECAELQMKGVNLFPFTADVLATPVVMQELAEMKQMGANSVAVNFMIYQQGLNGSDIYVGPGTPTNAVLTTFITAAHKLGLSVFLKPLVVCGGECIMVNVNPANINAWFESYTTYITQLATFAESLNVEVLSVALELMQISGKYQAEWEAVIAAVRQNFSGKLTYCSVMWPVETTQVTFWDSLDFISMDTYVPFWNGTGALPTLEMMIEKYTGYLGAVNNWHQSQAANISSKPIYLSEVGYPSMLEGLIVPYGNPPDECGETGILAPNFTAQEMAFDAVFSTLSETQMDIQGVNIFWFDNPTSADYYLNRTLNQWACGWTVRGKPAEQTIAKFYGGSVTNLETK